MAAEITWTTVPFDALTVQELYDLGQLRQAVFVVEQDCPYLDFDGKDAYCWHLMGKTPDQLLAAYARIVPPNVSYPNAASIGRVVVVSTWRGQGLGITLMQEALAAVAERWAGIDIAISAQDYLLDFYQSLGFVPSTDRYLEDGIPHTKMWYAPQP